MHDLKLLIAVTSLSIAPLTAFADITYPEGTTMTDAWTSPPRITADHAVEILSERFLAERESGVEEELGPEVFEALKYLVGDPEQALEEAPVQPGMRRFGGEILPENMTPEEDEFFENLSFALSTGLGLASLAPPEACVAQRRLWEVTKYKYDLGWNEIEIWGLTAFGHNIQYGVNHSDLVHGVFPWGVRMSWWGGLQCALDKPKTQDQLRACGTAKEWKIHGTSRIRHSSSYEHVVPGVAQASLTYAGALASGEGDQFRTNHQTRSQLNATWLLGPSNTPLPSDAVPSDGCIGDCGMGVAIDFNYRFSDVIAWYPNVILNASYNHVVPNRHERFEYSGHGDGNPHGLGSWTLRRDFSRHHAPFPRCS